MPPKKRVRAKYRAFEPLDGQLGQKDALKRLLIYLWPLKSAITGGFVFTLLLAAVNLGYGKFAKEFLDTIQHADKLGAVQAIQRLNSFTAVTVFVFLIKGVFSFGSSYSWGYASNQLILRLRNEVYAHLQRMSIGFFDHRKTGQLMASLSSDVPAVSGVLDAINDLLSAPVVLIGGTALLFWLNWPLALVSCLCLPPIAWIIVQTSRRIQRYTEQLQNSRSRVLDVAEETLSGIRVVKSFGNEEHEIQRFWKHSNHVARTVLHTIRIRNIMRPAVEFLGTVAVLLALWVGGQQAIHSKHLTFGDLVWFVLVLREVSNAARDMGQISINFSVAGVAADRVFTLLDYDTDIEEKPEAIELGRVEGQVKFERVDFAYSAGIPVLKDINFTMEPGEVVAIVGPTGAGKTTIAALIPRFYDVTNGAIRIDGIDVRDCTVKSLRHQIGIVPQDTALFAGTLRENIRYGRLDASDEEIEAAARTANAWEFIEQWPEGIETMIGERGVRLSGGQRQRIAIARAVLRDPRILILDEATSSLDSQSEALVQDALQRLVRDRTTLVIAHRLSTVRNADKILVVKEGHIVEEGRHEELMARGGVYSKLYQTQFRQKEQDLDSFFE